MSYNLLNNPHRTQDTNSIFDLFSTSKFRSASSQLCAAFPYYGLKFSHGAIVGFQVIIIAELYRKDSEIAMTMEQLSWFGGLNILGVLGTTVTGFAMHRLGTRLVALALNMLIIGSGFSYYYSTNPTAILISRALVGLISTVTMGQSYVTEISEPHLRGTLLVISQMTMNFGTFFTLLLGNFFHWRTIVLVNLCLPIVSAGTVLFTPNSPSWLANKGWLHEAEQSLCWLRGWVNPSKVQTEFQTLVESVQRSKVEAIGKNMNSRQFLQRSFYIPFGTMLLIFSAHQFSGINAIYGYSAIIFQQMNSPIDTSIATSIMGAIVVIGNVMDLLLIRHTGKRILAFFSVLVAGTSYGLIALVGFLKLEGDYLWVAPIAMLVGLFAELSGTNAIIFLLNSEIFPSSVRYIGASITFAYSVMLISLIKKVFLYVVDAITLPGTFCFFAVENFVAFLIYYFLMPETEGKSLEEIQERYKTVKKPKV